MSLLFRLPARFFSPLSSPGREVYLTILLAIFREAEHQLGLLNRETVVAFALDAIRADTAFAATEEIENEEPAFGAFEDDPPDVRRRARAGAILRYLERCGWLTVEVQANFSQQYLLPEHSFRLLKTLSEIADNQSASLQGLICSIHDLLTAAAQDGLAHIRIPEAFRQTTTFRAALQELHHNIGTHLEEITRKQEARQVLVHLFESYREQIVDKSYHQLRTTDHISRFRPALTKACEELAEENRIAATVAHATAADRDIDAAAFGEKTRRMLFTIVEMFNRLDGDLEAIDRRHAQFVDTAVSTIERLVTNQATTSGHTYEFLKALTSEEKSEPALAVLNDFFDLFEPQYVDSLSPGIPRPPAQRFVQSHATPVKLSRKAVSEEKKRTAAKLVRNLGKEKIKLLAEALLANREVCLASDISLKGPEDLPIIIYLRDYGDGSLGYKAKTLRPKAWVRSFGVGYYNFEIRKC